MQTVSISKKLLTNVLSTFVILTFFIATAQIIFSYFSVRHHFEAELLQLEVTINATLSQAIWEINDDQIAAIGTGLSSMDMVQAVIIKNENNSIIFQGGPLVHLLSQDLLANNSKLFGITSPLAFSLSNFSSATKINQVGYISLYSSDNKVLAKVFLQTIIPITGMLIGIAILIYLIQAMFKKLLTNPLARLTKDIAKIDLEKISHSKLDIPNNQNDELSLLARAFNSMLTKLEEYKEDLISANQQLDLQNISLEQEVTKKTAILNEVINKLAKQKNELERNDVKLRASIFQLKETQNQLVESEKMASLGSLVAGISHEINTPVGIGVTAASYLSECIGDLKKSVEQKSLTQSKMTKFLDNSQQSTTLLLNNLNKASQLIQSFKDIAVDQTSEAIRDVDLHKYLNEVITSLQPKLKRTTHRIVVNCTEHIMIRCRAGALSQIFTNMILNSIIHAFDDKSDGVITISLSQSTQFIMIDYCDNGSGISPENLSSLFEPFYTTKRGQGGSGLGTHILYNIVTQSLHGTIVPHSAPGQGLGYKIKFPRFFINS
ncbi:MAG: HAMP domain-containing protein [Gammaproteobacteria bacterium]|nr:HAMP domain-containing protein [Gammaproteobacteria bacterium]